MQNIKSRNDLVAQLREQKYQHYITCIFLSEATWEGIKLMATSLNTRHRKKFVLTWIYKSRPSGYMPASSDDV